MATTPAKRACPECGTLLPEEAEFCPSARCDRLPKPKAIQSPRNPLTQTILCKPLAAKSAKLLAALASLE